MLADGIHKQSHKAAAIIDASIRRSMDQQRFLRRHFAKDGMKHVKLGSQGLTVSVEGLGCMGMSAFYGPSDEAENLATLARAIELGIDFFDTAEIYGPFKNELLLAKAFKGKRDKVLIATKVGAEVTDEGERRTVNGTPTYINKAIDRSLRHLETDYVDLYYLHRIDPQVAIEESIGALKDLVTAGKVRYIGVSEAAPATLRRAHRVHPVTAVQTEYSLFERGVEPERGAGDGARTRHRLRQLFAVRAWLSLPARSRRSTISHRTISAASPIRASPATISPSIR